MTGQFIDKFESPLISVIIPTYNRSLLIIEAINSVIAQTYTNWELLIVDDGSTDGTVEAVRKIIDDRISIITLPHTGNISNVRNAGVKQSKGEWLAFLDSDDLWLPEKLALQMETLLQQKKRWVYGLYEYIDKNGKTIYNSYEKFAPYAGHVVKEVLLAKTGITICSLVIEKKLFDEIGGFLPHLKTKEDYEFFLRLALKAEAAIIEKIILQIRDHPNRTYKSIAYSYEFSTSAYRSFINLKPGKEFEKLARRRIAHFLSEGSVERFSMGHYSMALQQLGQSIWMGDNPRHWLSALKRGIYEAGKKYF